jgi:membrane dipeptidase
MLMEGADPIREPRAFEEWYERGVRIVGPAWSSTRYSGGTRAPGPLTSLGRELLDVMGSFRAVLDLSHMSEDAYFEACDRYHASLIASHSNPRRFVDTDRALSDEMIRRLAARNGVVGIVPYVKFLYQRGELPKTKADFSVMRIVDAIDHVCQVTGSAAHVGLGTDFDGGFGTEGLPAEIDTLADLGIIGTALAARGYAPAEVRGVLCGNFLRVLRAALPA